MEEMESEKMSRTDIIKGLVISCLAFILVFFGITVNFSINWWRALIACAVLLGVFLLYKLSMKIMEKEE